MSLNTEKLPAALSCLRSSFMGHLASIEALHSGGYMERLHMEASLLNPLASIILYL